MTVSAKREVKVELKSSAAGMDPGIRDARSKLKQLERDQARAAKQAERDAKRMRKEMLGAGRGLLGGVGNGMQMALGFQALGGIEGMARGVFDFNDQLMRFQLAARKTPAEAQKIGEAARQIATETGIAAEKVLAGARAYVDLAGAENYSEGMMRLLARSASASGAAIGDMATVAYSLHNALNIDPGTMEDVIGGLINQSKDGTIHFQNMAEEIIALGPKFARFGVTGRQGAAELGAMLQIAGSGFKDAAEASTGMQGLFRGLILHEDKFRKAGVATMTMGKDGAKHLRPLEEIVNDISKSGLMKDPSKLLKDVGRGEGEAFLQLWIKQIEKYKELTDAAMVNGVVQKDLATVTESSSGRMAISMEKVKNAFAEALTPERVDQIVSGIERMAESMGPLMTAVGKVADGFGSFVHMVARAKQKFQGDSKYEFSGSEKALVSGAEHGGWTSSWGREHKMTPSEMAKAAALKKKKAEYDAKIGDIMGGESDFGPTDDSIRKAIIAAKSDIGPDKATTGEGSAGRAYLSARSDEISAPRYKRIEAEVEQKAERERQMQYMTNTLTPVIQKLGKQITDAITFSGGGRGVSVKIGSEPIIKAARNSPLLNTSPGGR